MEVDSPNFEELETHGDHRGWVSEIYSGDRELDLRNVHYGTIEPGCVRGNHVHERTREWISFVGTPVEVRWSTDGDRESIILEEPFRVYLPPGVGHAFRNAGEETLLFAAYTNRRYREEDPDVSEVPLLEPEG